MFPSEMSAWPTWQDDLNSIDVAYGIDCLKDRIRVIEDTVECTSDQTVRELALFRLEEAKAELMRLELIK